MEPDIELEEATVEVRREPTGEHVARLADAATHLEVWTKVPTVWLALRGHRGRRRRCCSGDLDDDDTGLRNRLGSGFRTDRDDRLVLLDRQTTMLAVAGHLLKPGLALQGLSEDPLDRRTVDAGVDSHGRQGQGQQNSENGSFHGVLSFLLDDVADVIGAATVRAGGM